MILSEWFQNKNGTKSPGAKTWMIMKLTIVLMLFFTFQVTARSNAQRITIVRNNIHLSEVFQDIEQQTGFHFFYDKDLIQNTNPINVRLKEATLEQALLTCLKGQKLTYSIITNTVVIQPLKTKNPETELTSFSSEAPIELEGTVVDKNGIPLANVSVMVAGTKIGTTTDKDGHFRFSTGNNKNIILEVSSVGYQTKKVTVGNETQIHVVLEVEMSGLSDVVVTAYSTTTRAAITGSVSTINSKELELNSQTNIGATLQGLVPGVQVVTTSGQPGANQNILIRGIGSMTASSNPLYVVDGVPYDLSTNSIPTEDIQSISVLKDASASSLYGARAANGVILITTKKGTSGKAKINFYSSLSTSELAVPFPKKVSPAKQWETVWQGLYNDATDFKNMSDADARKYASDQVSGAFYNPMPFTLPDGTTRQYHSGWNTDYPIGLDGKVAPGAKRLWDFDSYDLLFKHRLTQNEGVSASGSFNEKNNYYVSFAHLDDKGSYIGDNYVQSSAHLSLDTKLAKWLSMSNIVTLARIDNRNEAFDVRPMRVLSRENTFYIWDYTTKSYKSRPLISDQLAIDNSNETGRTAYGGYAPTINLYNNKSDITENLSTITSLTGTIMTGLTFKSAYSYQQYNELFSLNTPPDDGTLLDQPDNGSINRTNTNSVTNYYNNVLTYDKTFGFNHHVNILLGQEAYMYKSSMVTADRSGLVLPFFNELDQATDYPGVSSNSDTYNLFSYFGKASYGYQDKYFLDASVRRDGSSRFSATQRWGNFFSGGAAWIVSREKFMLPTAHWLTSLKLKASFGELGNDNIGTYYGYQDFYGVGSNYYGNLGIIPNQLANPNLKWETNINSNIGAEFTIFDKFRGSVEGFKRQSKDLILGTPLPTSSGRDEVLRNIGDLQNTGYEVHLSYDIINSKNFFWSINGNATHFKNKITSLPFGSKMSQTELNGNTGVAYYKWIVGGSSYDLYCSDWADVNPADGRNEWWKFTFDNSGHVTSKVKTENFSEVNTEDQRVNVGSALPKVFGSFGSDFRYKDLDVNFMFYYSVGGMVYDYNYAESSVLRDSWAVYNNLDKAWKKPGDITNFPKIYEYDAGKAFSKNNIGSSNWVVENNFMRLKNLVIGYTIPNKELSRLKIQRFRIYLRGENLFTTGIMAKHGSDPEAGGLVGQNISGLTYFTTRKYTFGLNITL